MKKVDISANFLLVMNSKIYFDYESEKILCMSDNQILVYDDFQDFMTELYNMYEHVKQKTKA